MTGKRMNQPVLRFAVFQRDRGICRQCGFDTEVLRKQLLQLPYDERERKRRFLGIGRGRSSYWDVHHSTAVCDGGKDTLANAVTLCWRCHPKQTAMLLRDKATERHIHEETSQGLEEVYG